MRSWHPPTLRISSPRSRCSSCRAFTTQSGRTLKNVKVGWESYGTLNADKSNAILICHFFSGNSHAAGKYAEAEKVAGYWDAIIGPGKAIDTTKYFVFSSDTLVNLNAGRSQRDDHGPASIDPDTGKPYGIQRERKGFPIVSIRDFIEVQKKLVDSLGIKKLHMVGGASMGGLQTYEWAAAYPDMVGRIMPVISSAEADAGLSTGSTSGRCRSGSIPSGTAATTTARRRRSPVLRRR